MHWGSNEHMKGAVGKYNKGNRGRKPGALGSANGRSQRIEPVGATKTHREIFWSYKKGVELMLCGYEGCRAGGSRGALESENHRSKHIARAGGGGGSGRVKTYVRTFRTALWWGLASTGGTKAGEGPERRRPSGEPGGAEEEKGGSKRKRVITQANNLSLMSCKYTGTFNGRKRGLLWP
ncbi:hypothetical protein B0H17DRAFT_1149246 [Mycena rosella]|uniref:Uncharacterized protein n=1 Tax=Mycena rosella TaxID=1033263 RepID=A0AAD7FQX2_MYCRO|nr:hypothetical protein B0H17DRAFT_1149246 [Mycena rosella]